MSGEEVGARIFKAAVFGGITVVGLGLIFGFPSRPLWLGVVVAVCMLFSTLTMLAILVSLGSLAAGILIWAGLAPSGLDVSGWTKTAKAVVEQKASTSAAEAGKPATLTERLEQLAAACQKGLLSETECKAARDSLLEKFKSAQ
jgi:hypothetical protein